MLGYRIYHIILYISYVGRNVIHATQAVQEPYCGIILMRGYLIVEI